MVTGAEIGFTRLRYEVRIMYPKKNFTFLFFTVTLSILFYWVESQVPLKLPSHQGSWKHWRMNLDTSDFATTDQLYSPVLEHKII
jgi:hypothetical protein